MGLVDTSWLFTVVTTSVVMGSGPVYGSMWDTLRTYPDMNLLKSSLSPL